MKICQALIVVGFLVAANVVAAGVVLVLGQILQAIAPHSVSPWPWLAIGAAGAAAAFLFLKGAIFSAAEAAALGASGLFVAKRDPNKGLQSGSGQRGG